MADKNDKLVWVLPRRSLDFLGLPGASTFEENPELLIEFCALLLPPTLKNPEDPDSGDPRAAHVQAVFKRRGDVENDSSYVQIIPYCVVVDDTQRPLRVLVYNRGAKAGDSRLADEWSIGVGGHIGPEDAVIQRGGYGVITQAALRELGEELPDTLQVRLPLHSIGLFYNEDTEVNSVHLGMVGYFKVDSSTITSMGDGVEEYHWVELDELNAMELESWSCVVRDQFLASILNSCVGVPEERKAQ